MSPNSESRCRWLILMPSLIWASLLRPDKIHLWPWIKLLNNIIRKLLCKVQRPTCASWSITVNNSQLGWPHQCLTEPKAYPRWQLPTGLRKSKKRASMGALRALPNRLLRAIFRSDHALSMSGPRKTWILSQLVDCTNLTLLLEESQRQL